MADKRIYELTEASTVGSSDVLALDSQNMAQTKKVKVKTITDPLSDKYDIASLNLTGSTNTSGGTIEAGRYFYLNGDLVKAKTDIAAGATFTAGTNYVSAYVGTDLAEIKQTLSTNLHDFKCLYSRHTSSAQTLSYNIPGNGVFLVVAGGAWFAPQLIFLVLRDDVGYSLTIKNSQVTTSERVTDGSLRTFTIEVPDSGERFYAIYQVVGTHNLN